MAPLQSRPPCLQSILSTSSNHGRLDIDTDRRSQQQTPHQHHVAFSPLPPSHRNSRASFQVAHDPSGPSPIVSPDAYRRASVRAAIESDGFHAAHLAHPNIHYNASHMIQSPTFQDPQFLPSAKASPFISAHYPDGDIERRISIFSIGEGREYSAEDEESIMTSAETRSDRRASDVMGKGWQYAGLREAYDNSTTPYVPSANGMVTPVDQEVSPWDVIREAKKVIEQGVLLQQQASLQSPVSSHPTSPLPLITSPLAASTRPNVTRMRSGGAGGAVLQLHMPPEPLTALPPPPKAAAVSSPCSRNAHLPLASFYYAALAASPQSRQLMTYEPPSALKSSTQLIPHSDPFGGAASATHVPVTATK